MLTKEELDTLQDHLIKAAHIQSKIASHMYNAIKLICEIYGGKLDWWRFQNYDCDYCNGEFEFNSNSITIDVTLEIRISDIDSNYLEEFPKEFLIKSLDEIKEIVTKEKDAAQAAKEKAIAKKKEQKLARDAKKAELRNSALNKLSKEEAKALGL